MRILPAWLIVLWVASTPLAATFIGESPDGPPIQETREVIESKAQVFENDLRSCTQNGSCELKRAKIFVRMEIISHDVGDGPQRSWWTDMRASYETTSLSAVEEFAFVQLVRGCFFRSSVDAAGRVKKSFGTSVTSFDQGVTFRFPEWVIDSTDTDPVYRSRKGALTRHDDYIWGVPMDGELDGDSVSTYGIRRPTIPVLMVSDSPSSASLMPGGGGMDAQNASLEFRLCIYKTRDIPLKTSRHDLQFASPIHCFDWAHSYIYDHASGEYRKPAGIDPFCSTRGNL